MKSIFIQTKSRKVLITVLIGWAIVWGIITIAKSGFGFGQWLYQFTH